MSKRRAPSPGSAMYGQHFTIVLRGYDRRQVDSYLDTLAGTSGRDAPPRPSFRTALRGYERTEVDAYLDARGIPPTPAAGTPSAVPASAAGAPEFTVVLRGYDCQQVDAYLAHAHRLAEAGEPVPDPSPFTTVLRGYEVTQVDDHIDALQRGPAR